MDGEHLKSPIPIVGGGIAGLTTALALAHFGVASIIHEQAKNLDEVGAGIQLSPNAMYILRALGLADALAEHAVAPLAIALRNGRTDTPVATVPLGDVAQARYGAPYLVIHRADLQATLVKACQASDLVTLKLGSTVEPDETVPLMIAADGVHSAWRTGVRRTAGSAAHKHFSGYVAWRAVEPVSKNDLHTHVWFGPNAHLVDYPIRAGKARNLVAISRQDDPRPVRANPAKVLEQAFAGWHGDVRARLSAVESWTPWPLFAVDPEGPWTTEHVALVGDAAHAMLPFAAQGGAMAIEDAWVLAQMLRSTPQSHQALYRFEKARRLRVVRVWKEAQRNGQIYHLSGPVAFARDTVLKVRSGENLLKRFDWLYGWRPSET